VLVRLHPVVLKEPYREGASSTHLLVPVRGGPLPPDSVVIDRYFFRNFLDLPEQRCSCVSRLGSAGAALPPRFPAWICRSNAAPAFPDLDLPEQRCARVSRLGSAGTEISRILTRDFFSIYYANQRIIAISSPLKDAVFTLGDYDLYISRDSATPARAVTF